MKSQLYLNKYCIIDNFNIFQGTDYLVLYRPYLQNYLPYLVVLGIFLKLKKPSLMVNFCTDHHFCVLSHCPICSVKCLSVYLFICLSCCLYILFPILPTNTIYMVLVGRLIYLSAICPVHIYFPLLVSICFP